MISVFPTPSAVAEAVAAAVAGVIAGHPVSTVGLAGGSTPAATYTRLAALDLPWDRTRLWLGDERWVPADDPDANAGMVRRTLGPGASRLVAPDYAAGDPERAAADYAAELSERLGRADPHGRPTLVLLGMGDDGHTASLFPGTAALEVTDRSYVANWVPAHETWRLTATLPLLWSARQLFFVVTGANKAPMLHRIVDEGEPLPAGRVAAGAEQVTWFVDEAAASELMAPGS